MAEPIKKEEPKKKLGLLGKLKEAADDKEEQIAVSYTHLTLPTKA